MTVGPLNEDEAVTTAGPGAAALNLTEAECLRVDEDGAGT